MKRSKSTLTATTILLTCLTLWTCEKKDIDIDITSCKWEVISSKKSGQIFSDKPKDSYILEFNSDTTYSLSLDINNCDGQYEISDKGKINFTTVVCTLICCDSEFAENLPPLLHNITDYFIRGDILTLTGDGQIKLERL